MKIFVTRDIPERGIEMLKDAGHTVDVYLHDIPITYGELLKTAGKYDAMLCMSIDKIDSEFLEANKHLKVISQFAAGYNNIDVQKATELGIPLGYAPEAMSNAAADVAFMLMITTSRKMCYMHKTIEKGEWDYFRPKANLGMELNGKKLGIFGLGKIGMEMARKCKGAYQMQILYCNRGRNEKAETELGARKVDFDELLSESDVLSVHCSLSEETNELFNSEAFSKMKNSALFINTSRGKVHNEQDLIKALQDGEIWGAGLDVTNPEPMHSDNPLLNMENVSITPHIGSATVEARNRMSEMAAENIIKYANGERIINIINPEVYE